MPLIVGALKGGHLTARALQVRFGQWHGLGTRLGLGTGPRAGVVQVQVGHGRVGRLG